MPSNERTSVKRLPSEKFVGEQRTWAESDTSPSSTGRASSCAWCLQPVGLRAEVTGSCLILELRLRCPKRGWFLARPRSFVTPWGS